MSISDERENKDINTTKEKPFKKFVTSTFPCKGDSVKQVIFKIVFIIAFISLIVSSVFLITYFYGEAKIKKLNDDLRSQYSGSDSSIIDISKPDPKMLDKFVKLYNTNPDIVGWIEIPNTTISYPVMQTTDNDYYLKHDFNKEDSRGGAIFADFRIPLTKYGMPQNTVLYGHDMDNGDFFSQLRNYKKLDFFKKSPTFTFDSLYENQTWKIFACFMTSIRPDQDGGVVFDYHNRISFSNESQFNDFYSEVMKRSYYLTDTDVKFGDELITLSTCDREFADSRFVVVARKVREGEDNSVDVSKIVKNENKYMPLVWYKVTGQKPPR